MSRLITIAEFPNGFDVKYSLIKDMLDEAGIQYITTNENARITKPMIANISNISLEIRVYEENLNEALELINSIK